VGKAHHLEPRAYPVQDEHVLDSMLLIAAVASDDPFTMVTFGTGWWNCARLGHSQWSETGATD